MRKTTILLTLLLIVGLLVVSGCGVSNTNSDTSSTSNDQGYADSDEQPNDNLDDLQPPAFPEE